LSILQTTETHIKVQTNHTNVYVSILDVQKAYEKLGIGKRGHRQSSLGICYSQFFLIVGIREGRGILWA